MRARWARPVVLSLLAVACRSRDGALAEGALVRMDFARPDFYAAPFPSDDLRGSDGTIALRGFPNPSDIVLARDAIALITRDARGFAATGGVFFSLDAAIDPARLPASMAESTTDGASAFLIDVDDSSPGYLRRSPVTVAFEADGGPFGAANLVSLVPLQGAPLRPSTLYAAVILRRAAEPPLRPSSAMASLAAGARPGSLSDSSYASYARALGGIAKAGIAPSEIAALTAFTTDDPLRGMSSVVTDLLSRAPPSPTAFTLTETFPEFCVYHATIGMPDYQSGAPPFSDTGGDWRFDASGAPILQRVEPANLIVSVPRAPMPASGYPTTIFVRTGGGGDRPLVDRGTQATNGGPPITPGTGPALELARAGFAGIQVDGPLGGLRNTTGADEQFLVFNIFNGAALRDNVRESAAELVLLSHVVDGITIDTAACPGAGPQMRIDPGALAIMGHSMGASILPLTLAFEPRLRAAVLSGAGASWIENVLYKQHPLAVRPAVEVLLQYSGGRSLSTRDPVLTLIQWAAEPADSQVYATRIVREPPPGFAPRHVLMVQGIVDHYILPPIANAISAPLGLDLAGGALDAVTPEVAAMETLASTFPFSGRGQLGYPVRGNSFGATAVVVQVAGDGVEDGHEVIFQTAAPKYQYKCFLASLLGGTPVVLDGAGKSDDAACE